MKNTIAIPSDIFMSSVLESLAKGNKVKILVTGRSMSPTFRHKKDCVVLEKTAYEDIGVGDVVLFDRGDTICIHRVIKKDGDRLIIRGDGNSSKALETATADKVYGKVVAGTMLGGKPFTINDSLWQRQNRRVEKYFPIWEFWHYIRNILVRYPLSITVFALSLYLSFCPQNGGNFPFKNFDKFAHMAMYLAISCVWWFEWLKAHIISSSTIRKGLVMCFVLPIISGGLVEIAQGCLTNDRNGDFMDFLSNVCGVIVALIFTFAVTIPSIKRFRKKRNLK